MNSNGGLLPTAILQAGPLKAIVRLARQEITPTGATAEWEILDILEPPEARAEWLRITNPVATSPDMRTDSY